MTYIHHRKGQAIRQHTYTVSIRLLYKLKELWQENQDIKLLGDPNRQRGIFYTHTCSIRLDVSIHRFCFMPLFDARVWYHTLLAIPQCLLLCILQHVHHTNPAAYIVTTSIPPKMVAGNSCPKDQSIVRPPRQLATTN